jgi:hypothetical protein
LTGAALEHSASSHPQHLTTRIKNSKFHDKKISKEQKGNDVTGKQLARRIPLLYFINHGQALAFLNNSQHHVTKLENNM